MDTQVAVRMSADLVAEIERYRAWLEATTPGATVRTAEAIRRLIAGGLQAWEASR